MSGTHLVMILAESFLLGVWATLATQWARSGQARGPDGRFISEK